MPVPRTKKPEIKDPFRSIKEYERVFVVGSGGRVFLGIADCRVTNPVELREVREVVTIRAMTAGQAMTKTFLEAPIGGLLPVGASFTIQHVDFIHKVKISDMARIADLIIKSEA
jgi:hypothetical protein